MSETANADSAYYHTLTARPYYFPNDSGDPRLKAITSCFLQLPAEIRFKIYQYAFSGNRVAVTARNGCYCASEYTGPYRADHKWLLDNVTGPVRQDAQHAFIQLSLWELHCEAAFNQFLTRVTKLGAMEKIRHIRINVYEPIPDWHLPLDQLPSLQTVTFSPWQKSWSIDISAREGYDELSDVNVMKRVHRILNEKNGYQPVNTLLASPRSFEIFLVFPIRYLLPGKVIPYRWQLKIWRANLDTETIDRQWNEVHLVQEATLE